MKPFAELWQELTLNLEPGQKIPNWTAYSGRLGDYMVVVGVKQNSIRIDSAGAKHTVTVPKSDFETVWGVWADYKTQRLRRSELTELTRFSKYVISVLHWYETLTAIKGDETDQKGSKQLGLWGG